jgi:hypothetical protein
MKPGMNRLTSSAANVLMIIVTVSRQTQANPSREK